MELNNKILKINKNLSSFIFFIIFWSSFLFFTGTLTSGFHFIDDHETIKINKKINDYGLLNATKSILVEDLNLRFRPFYYFSRAILTKFIGSNFFLWSIFNAILAIATSYFLFLFIYTQGYNFIHALLFPFLTLIGTQAAIWWRLGPAESIGIFLLSASLFFLANSIFKKQNYQLILSTIFLLCAALSKESFAICIPAYILILLYFKKKSDSNISILNLIRGNIGIILFLILILFIEIIIIIFVLRPTTVYMPSYSSFNIFKFLKFIYEHLKHNPYIYIITFGIFLLLKNLKKWRINPTTELKKIAPYVYNFVIMLAVIMPQFIFYYNSGLYERYLLPLNFGFSFFIIYLLNKIYENNEISIFIKRAFTLTISIIVFYFLINGSLPNAKAFAKDGIATNQFLSTIVANTKKNDSIVIVLSGSENAEVGYSLNLYLTIEADRKNVYFYKTNTYYTNDGISKGLDSEFSKYFYKIIVKELNDSFSCVAVLPFSANNEVKKRFDNSSMYQRKDFGGYTIFIKNNI